MGTILSPLSGIEPQYNVVKWSIWKENAGAEGRLEDLRRRYKLLGFKLNCGFCVNGDNAYNFSVLRSLNRTRDLWPTDQSKVVAVSFMCPQLAVMGQVVIIPRQSRGMVLRPCVCIRHTHTHTHTRVSPHTGTLLLERNDRGIPESVCHWNRFEPCPSSASPLPTSYHRTPRMRE
jgi:hypothetical protein